MRSLRNIGAPRQSRGTGAPRPARFQNPFGGQFLFGDGSYSQNIVQGGSVLQPQEYTVGHADQQTAGPHVGNASLNYLILDRSWFLSPGETVTHIGAYCNGTSNTQPIHILRRNVAGNYTSVLKSSITFDATAGWQYFELATPFVVPIDGLTYHVGIFSAAAGIVYVGSTPRAWVSGDKAQDATFSMGEDSTNAFLVCARYRRTTLQDCIVITAAATVAPDAETDAAAYTARHIVVESGGSLAPSTNCKGLIGIISESAYLANGGVMHTDKLGKAGDYGDLTVLDLVPASIRRKLKSSLSAFVVEGEGADGGAGKGPVTGNNAGNPGAAAPAGSMKTGGGGSGSPRGSVAATVGAGGGGGPCSGGAGSGASCRYTVTGASAAASPHGGPASPGVTDNPTSFSAGGGAGDTPGASVGNTPVAPTGAGGGLLMLFTPTLSIASGCVVSADGGGGGTGGGTSAGGGGAGGGCVVVVTQTGGYTNAGTVRASGGPGGIGTSGNVGGAGGAGSVNTFTV